MCNCIGLGQNTSHGMDFFNKTKCSEFPAALAYKVIENAMKTHKPADASAMIELKLELDKIHF